MQLLTKECISVRRYKPDILVLLALIFGLGIVVTTYSQELLSSRISYYSPDLETFQNPVTSSEKPL
jgi:hypothetical protein